MHESACLNIINVLLFNRQAFVVIFQLQIWLLNYIYRVIGTPGIREHLWAWNSTHLSNCWNRVWLSSYLSISIRDILKTAPPLWSINWRLSFVGMKISSEHELMLCFLSSLGLYMKPEMICDWLNFHWIPFNFRSQFRLSFKWVWKVFDSQLNLV